VKSIPFTVGGHNWVVRYYPNGCPAENLPYCISVFLVLDSVLAKGVKAKVRFSLLDKDGEAVASHSRTTDENIFPTKDSTWGIRDFIKKADLESSVHLRDDSFSIRCDVTVVRRIHKGSRSVSVPPSDLHQHLGDLLKSSEGAGVTFHVGG
jgi:speckle-type POZ protein